MVEILRFAQNDIMGVFFYSLNVDKLIFYEIFPDPIAAISAEKKIKGWTRKKKIDLIKSKNPEFRDLIEEFDS